MSVLLVLNDVADLPIQTPDPQLPIRIGFMRGSSLGDAGGGVNGVRFELAAPVGSGEGRGGGLWYGIGKWYFNTPNSLAFNGILGNPLNWFVTQDSKQIALFSVGAVSGLGDGVTRAIAQRDQAGGHLLGIPDGSGVSSIDITTANAAVTVTMQLWFCVWRRDVWAFGGPRWPEIFD